MFKMKMFFMIVLLFLFGFMGVLAENQHSQGCPNEYVKINRDCYLFSTFQETWQNASNFCKSQGTNLTFIHAEKEKLGLQQYFVTRKMETKWWAGFKRDTDTSSVWKWLDGYPVSDPVISWKDSKIKSRTGDFCGILDIASKEIKLAVQKCQTKQNFICETPTEDQEKVPDIVATTPSADNHGATLPYHGKITSEREESVDKGHITSVSKANGQMTIMAGGLFSSVRTVLASKDVDTSPRVNLTAEDKTAVKLPSTVDSSVSKNDKEDVKDTIVPTRETTQKTDMTTLTSTHMSMVENYDRTISERSSTYDFEDRSRLIVTETYETSSTVPPTTQPSWTSPETPQPTFVDWVKAYQEFKGCYVPGTGGSIINTVETGRIIYPDDLTACPKVRIGSIKWPSVKAGETAIASCAGGQGLARFNCSAGRVCWQGEPDITKCTSVELQALIEKIGTGVAGSSPPIEETIKLTSTLTRITRKETKTMEDLITASKLLTALTTKTTGVTNKAQVEAVIQNIVKTGSNLISGNNTVWEKMSQEDRVRSASSLLVAIETAAVSMAENINEPAVIITKGVDIDVEVRVLDKDTLQGESQSIVYGSNQSENTFSIPVETLKDLSEGKFVKVVFITHYAFSDILSWRSSKQTAAPSTQPNMKESNFTGSLDSEDRVSGNSTTVVEGPKIASHVLSASVGGDRLSNVKLRKSVTFVMKHLQEVNTKYIPHCSFWDLRQDPKLGFWSQDGCRVLHTNRSHTECECDHMTNFAILLDVHGVEMSKIHKSMLRLVTIIGCFISCVSLLASWITFQCFTSLQGERNSIHKNLAVTLLIAEILFVFGIYQTEHKIACSVIAGFLHFFFLAAFTWMFIEGLHIIFMLVQVFDATRSRLPFYYLAGYGAPLIVVGVSCLFFYDGYGTDEYCWLKTDQYFIWAFAGPVAAILLINAVFLTYAMSTVCRHSDYVFNSKDKSNTSGIRAWVQGALALEVLLGLTWTLGYFLINDDTLPLAYVFAILNSLQGLFIFIFHCLLNKKAQKEYRQVVRSVVRRSPSTVTTQSTLTKRTHHTNNSHELNNSPSNSQQKLNATNSHSLA